MKNWGLANTFKRTEKTQGHEITGGKLDRIFKDDKQ